LCQSFTGFADPRGMKQPASILSGGKARITQGKVGVEQETFRPIGARARAVHVARIRENVEEVRAFVRDAQISHGHVDEENQCSELGSNAEGEENAAGK